ncbi:MAG: hypothetical protein JW881_13535 [Spirochaetales bacterium]|nr:hypothetical protein [Spirochaetales bacterium]
MNKTVLPVVFFILASCVSAPAPPPPGSAVTGMIETIREDSAGDILGVAVSVPEYRVPDNYDTLSGEYVTLFNQFVDAYNDGDYSDALVPLFRIIHTYDDLGKSLDAIGICYLSLEEYGKAVPYLIYAEESGYSDDVRLEEQFFHAFFGIGYNKMTSGDYRFALAYFKEALGCKADPAVKNNIAWCYTRLSESAPLHDSIGILENAIRFVSGFDVDDQYLEDIAFRYVKAVIKAAEEARYANAAGFAEYALSRADSPYIRLNLGLLYIRMRRIAAAHAEFGHIVTHHKASDVFDIGLTLYNETKSVRYRHEVVYPFTVIPAGGTQTEAYELEITARVPQTCRNQKTEAIKAYVNGTAVPFSALTDNTGNSLIEFSLKGPALKKGKNEIKITSTVEKTSIFTGREEIEAYSIGNYNRNDPFFRQNLASDNKADYTLPEIRAFTREITSRMTSESVLERVSAVYDFVIDKLSYVLDPEGTDELRIGRLIKNSYRGNCQDYALLTIALLRSLGVPASMYCGDTYDSDIGHAWAVFYTPDKRAVALDATWGDHEDLKTHYFLTESNKNITTSFSYDSDILEDGRGINLFSKGFTVELGDYSYTIEITD